MKIVCDACQAKYSISDDKVQGKVFKIRCKKCSNIIVVRGGAGASEPAPQPAVEKDTRVYDYGYEGGGAPAGDDAVWHVVINQDQVGPMTAADVMARISAGEVDGDTYAWREGFADWMPLAQVDAFAAYVAGGGGGAPEADAGGGGGGGAEAVASMFSTAGLGGEEAGTTRSDPGDLFAAASASSRRAEPDGDLFGGGPPAESQAAANEAAAAKLRGERNENSVLFSLNNLAQLASDKPAPAAAASSSSSSSSAPLGHATGAAGGEGSGLIDIRSMANAYLGGSGGSAAKPAASAAIGSIDDLPVFGGGGFSEPAVLVPTSRPANNNKLLYALIGSVGVLAIAAVILVVVMMGKGGDDKKPAGGGSAVAASGAPGGEGGEPAPKAGGDDKPAVDPAAPPATGSAAPTEEPKAVPPPEPKEEPKEEPKTEPKHEPKTEPRRGSTSRTPPSRASATPTPARREPPSKPESGGGGGCDEVSCLLASYEGACCAKFKKSAGKSAGAKPASGGGDVPDRLDRGMISEGVAKVKSRVMACGSKSSKKGTVKVKVSVSASGSVSGINVMSTPDPALGSCVASAMQGARFRKTTGGGSFLYPWVF